MSHLLLLLNLAFLDGTSMHYASFEMVWNIIDEKHWDLEETGVDWQAVKEELAPKAKAAQSYQDIRAVIDEMIARLGQSHFGLLGGTSFGEIESLKSKAKNGMSDLGMQVRVVDDRLFVTKVNPKGEAAQKGLNLGSEILKIGDVSVKEIVSTINEAYRDSRQKAFFMTRVTNEFIHHYTNEEVAYQVVQPGENAPSTIHFENKNRIPTEKYFPNMPPMNFEFESRVLENNVGYVHFNIWLQPIIQKFPKALQQLNGTDGLILDLRGNPGGLGLLASGVAGYLVPEKGKKLGTMQAKEGHLNFLIIPRKQQYSKPVAVLIDEGSASTSEILALGLFDLGRAKLFGSKSAGAALPSFVEELPNGDRFQYAFGDYTSIGGAEVEGVGVTPEPNSTHTIDSLKSGKDAAIEAASAWIRSQK